MVLGAMVHRGYAGISILASGVPGTTFSCTRAHHAHRVLGENMAAARECFKFSQQSTSNDHYMA